MIESYQFGSMTISGRKHRKDLKIIQGHVIPRWWRKQGHHVDETDMEDIFAAKPEILIVGQGYSGMMHIGESLRTALEKSNIRLIAAPTGQAYQHFNQLVAEEKNVAGAFHLTC